MRIEQKVSYYLNRFPGIKRVIKRMYQFFMYIFSPKLISEGDILRVSPKDNKEYFFGYYDKSPWDSSGRYILCLCASNTWSDVAPKEKADILLIDTENGNSAKKIAETSSWNVQQGCMLQWLGPDFHSKIIYNDFRNGKYVSVVLEIESGCERILSAPIYTVSLDGKFALTLDFSRLHTLRPGYGYCNIPDSTAGIAIPNSTCIWKVDLCGGKISSILNYCDFVNFCPRPEMEEKGTIHKVNHLMINPEGDRFMVLYRWFNGYKKFTRLITCNIDGSDMYVLSDDDMISHCCWKDNNHILAYANKKGQGQGYYLMEDKTQDYQHLWKRFSNDGHPSYSPTNNNLVLTDTYPDRSRVAELKLVNDMDVEAKDALVIARVFAPFKYDNDTRCDLHPRWSRDGKKICFDSVYEGHRGLYIINL